MNKTIKLAALVLLTSISSAASAQVWIGGSLGYNHSETGFDEKWGNEIGNTTTDYFHFAPEIGCNLNEKVAVALALGYDHSNGMSNQWRFNPYIRYHFAESGSIRFFIDSGLIYSHSHYNGLEAGIDTFGFSFNPGVSYAINKRLGLVAHLGELGYTHGHVDATVGCYSNNNFNLGVTNSLSLGMYFNL